MASSLTLYDLTVPMLSRALTEHIAYLKLGEKWCEDHGVDKKTLLEGRLASDMKPLTFQTQRACDSVKFLLMRVGSEELPAIADDEASFADLYARLQKSLDFLSAARKEGFKGPDDDVNFVIGGNEMSFTALGYVQRFALPNFWFHQTAAYMILRNAGVPVGKRDFLGWSTLQG